MNNTPSCYTPNIIDSPIINGANTAPSRIALLEAMRINIKNGNENLGFLSEKNGFMPAHHPLLNLPSSHHAWDNIAHDLPTLYRNQTLRQKLEAMSVLPSDKNSIDDTYLCRASVILSILAHAYTRVEKKPPAGIPVSIHKPWLEITRRLNRPEPFLSYMDLIVYNWKIRDKSLPDPMRVENLDLLIPTVNTQEEQIFYLTQVEILSQTSSIVLNVVNAQEAVLNNDHTKLIIELTNIRKTLEHITLISLPKINPQSKNKSHVNPIIWAKTVAPFAVPIKDGIQGPSGTSSPFFHLMDVFLKRTNYDSILGKEALRIREWYPPHLREFFSAVDKISVPAFIAKSQDANLTRAYNEMLDAYIGGNGFLGIHRRKVYGYLQMAFKVGRTITIGGFQGPFEDRTWIEVDNQLETTRKERISI